MLWPKKMMPVFYLIIVSFSLPVPPPKPFHPPYSIQLTKGTGSVVVGRRKLYPPTWSVVVCDDFLMHLGCDCFGPRRSWLFCVLLWFYSDWRLAFDICLFSGARGNPALGHQHQPSMPRHCFASTSSPYNQEQHLTQGISWVTGVCT